MAQAESATQVQQAILALPLASRSVLILREYQGFSYQEIADRLERRERYSGAAAMESTALEADAVVAAFTADVDRTLLRENLGRLVTVEIRAIEVDLQTDHHLTMEGTVATGAGEGLAHPSTLHSGGDSVSSNVALRATRPAAQGGEGSQARPRHPAPDVRVSRGGGGP